MTSSRRRFRQLPFAFVFLLDDARNGGFADEVGARFNSIRSKQFTTLSRCAAVEDLHKVRVSRAGCLPDGGGVTQS